MMISETVLRAALSDAVMAKIFARLDYTQPNAGLWRDTRETIIAAALPALQAAEPFTGDEVTAVCSRCGTVLICTHEEHADLRERRT